MPLGLFFNVFQHYWGTMNYLEKFLKTLLIASLLMPLIAQESEDEDEGLEVVVTTATKTKKIYLIQLKLSQHYLVISF